MIRFLDDAQLPVYRVLCEENPVIGARMYTQLAVYGADSGIADLWLQFGTGGKPTAALMRFDGWLVIAPAPEADAGELAKFLTVLGGFSYIESTPGLCRKLNRLLPGEYDSSATMRFAGSAEPQPDAAIDPTPPLREVFDLIRAGSAFMEANTHWESWYPHTSHLIRHGLGFAAVLREQGEAVATGGVYAAGERYAVIGSVTTRREHRGKGYAARVVRHLCARCAEHNKTPALFVSQDSLVEYYARLGFEPFGQWAQIELQV